MNFFDFDEDSLCKGFKLPKSTIRKLFQNGTFMGSVLELRTCHALGWINVSSLQLLWDAENGEDKNEIRSVTKRGASFTIGYLDSGLHRQNKSKVELDALFLKKIRSVSNFLLGDITQFPHIPYVIIPSKEIGNLILGKNKRLSYTRCVDLMNYWDKYGSTPRWIR